METLSNSVFIFIINAIWQISVLLAIALVCSRLMRHAAVRYRHLLWTAILILSVVLPVWSLFSFGGINSKFVLPLSFKNNQRISDVGATDKQTAAGNQISVQIREQPSSSNASIFLLAVSVCYFSFLAYRGANLWKMWRRTERLLRSARNEKLTPLIDSVAERCCAVLNIKPVPILISSETNTPLTLGVRKPLIILPKNFIDITSSEAMTAALGHESAHIRRRDYCLNLVYEFLSLFVSFHPAVPLIKRKINQTRELACDELVAESLLKPLDYARSLIQIAGFTSPVSQNTYTLGVFNADILEKRIMKLIETNRNTNNRIGKIRFLFIVTLLGVTTLAASVFSFALPGNQTPASETKQNAAKKQYHIEIYDGSRLFQSMVLGSDSAGRSSYSFSIFRPKNQTAQTPEGERIYAFLIFPKLEKGVVKVEVLAVLEDMNMVSNDYPIDKLKKQSVGAYSVREDETAAFSEMRKFGVEPLEVKVVSYDILKNS